MTTTAAWYAKALRSVFIQRANQATTLDSGTCRQWHLINSLNKYHTFVVEDETFSSLNVRGPFLPSINSVRKMVYSATNCGQGQIQGGACPLPKHHGEVFQCTLFNELIILSQKVKKIFWGGGSDPIPIGEGDTPSSNPTPNASIVAPAALDLGAFSASCPPQTKCLDPPLIAVSSDMTLPYLRHGGNDRQPKRPAPKQEEMLTG